VDGEIDSAFEKSLFNLLGEHAFDCAGLSRDLGEGYTLQAIAGGFDDFNLDGVALVAEQRGDVIGLPEGKLGTAASDTEIHRRPPALASGTDVTAPEAVSTDSTAGDSGV